MTFFEFQRVRPGVHPSPTVEQKVSTQQEQYAAEQYREGQEYEAQQHHHQHRLLCRPLRAP